MHKGIYLGALLIATGFATRSEAELVTASPSAFGSGTIVSAAYEGVTLSHAQGALDTDGPVITVPLHLISSFSGPIYAEGTRFAHSGGAIWSAGPCCNDFTVLRADFSRLTSYVSMLFLPNDNDSGILQAYDAQHNLISEKVLISTAPFTLEIETPTAMIAYALATFGDTGELGYLTFDVAPVPVPASLALAGLPFLMLVRRKAQKISEQQDRF